MPTLNTTQAWLLAIAIIWSLAWKGIALWKSARRNQLAWFVCLLVINTVGILEIIYISFFQSKSAYYLNVKVEK
jgi:methionyl-tRNA synthetase